MPTINEKFPPPHGTDHPLVSSSLQVCGVTIMVALLLTLYGLLLPGRPRMRTGETPDRGAVVAISRWLPKAHHRNAVCATFCILQDASMRVAGIPPGMQRTHRSEPWCAFGDHR